jgi:hypothetical protein
MGVDPELRARADAVAEASDNVRAQWRRGRVDPSQRTREYEIVLGWFVLALEAFFTPVERLPEQVRVGDPEAIEVALSYLETAPRCFRSGYLAEQLMRRLARAHFTPDQRTRVASIVIAETSHRQSRGWRDIGALAGAVWDDLLADSLAVLSARGGLRGLRATRITAAAAVWRASTR